MATIRPRSFLPGLEQQSRQKRDETFVSENEIKDKKNAIEAKLVGEKAQAELAYKRAMDNVENVTDSYVQDFNKKNTELVDEKLIEDDKLITDKYNNTYLDLATKLVEKSNMSTSNKMDALNLIALVDERVKNKIYNKKLKKNDDITSNPVELPNKLPVVDQDHIRLNPDYNATTISDTVILKPGKEVKLITFDELDVTYRNEEFMNSDIGAFILQLKLRANNIAIDLYLSNTLLTENKYGTAIVSESSYNFDNSLMVSVYKEKETHRIIVTLKNVEQSLKQETLVISASYNMLLGGNVVLPDEITESFVPDSRYKKIGEGVVKGDEKGVVGPINNVLGDRNFYNAILNHIAVSDNDMFGESVMVKLSTFTKDMENADVRIIESDIKEIDDLRNAVLDNPVTLQLDGTFTWRDTEEDGRKIENEPYKYYYDKGTKRLFLASNEGLLVYDFDSKKPIIVEEIGNIKINKIKYDLFDNKLKIATENGMWEATLGAEPVYTKLDLDFEVLNDKYTINRNDANIPEDNPYQDSLIMSNIYDLANNDELYTKCEKYAVKDFMRVTTEGLSVDRGERLVSNFNFIKLAENQEDKIIKTIFIHDFYTSIEQKTPLSANNWENLYKIHNKKIVEIGLLEGTADFLIKYIDDENWNRISALDPETDGYKVWETGIYDTTTGEGVLAVITNTNKLFITNDLTRWREIRLPEECDGSIWADIKYMPNIVPNVLKTQSELSGKTFIGSFIMVSSSGTAGKRIITSHDCEKWYVIETPAEADTYEWKFITGYKFTPLEIDNSKPMWSASSVGNAEASTALQNNLKRAYCTIYTENLNEAKMLSFNGTTFVMANSDITNADIKANNAKLKKLIVITKIVQMSNYDVTNTLVLGPSCPYMLLFIETEDDNGKNVFVKDSHIDDLKTGTSILNKTSSTIFVNESARISSYPFKRPLHEVSLLTEEDETSDTELEETEPTPDTMDLVDYNVIYENFTEDHVAYLQFIYLRNKSYIELYLQPVPHLIHNYIHDISLTKEVASMVNRIYHSSNNGFELVDVVRYVKSIPTGQVKGEITDIKAAFVNGTLHDDKFLFYISSIENGEFVHNEMFSTEVNDEVLDVLSTNQKYLSDVELYNIETHRYIMKSGKVARKKQFVLRKEKIYKVTDETKPRANLFKERTILFGNHNGWDMVRWFGGSYALSNDQYSYSKDWCRFIYDVLLTNREIPLSLVHYYLYDVAIPAGKEPITVGDSELYYNNTPNSLNTEHISFIPYKKDGMRNVAIVIGKSTPNPIANQNVFTNYLECGLFILTDFNYENTWINKFPYSILREDEFDIIDKDCMNTWNTAIGMCEYYPDYNPEEQFLIDRISSMIQIYKEEDGNTVFVGKKYLRGNYTILTNIIKLPELNGYIFGDNYRWYIINGATKESIINRQTMLNREDELGRLNNHFIIRLEENDGSIKLLAINQNNYAMFEITKYRTYDYMTPENLCLSWPHPKIKYKIDNTGYTLYKMLESAGLPYDQPCKCTGFIIHMNMRYPVSHVTISKPWYNINFVNGDKKFNDEYYGNVEFLIEPEMTFMERNVNCVNTGIDSWCFELENKAYRNDIETTNENIGLYPGLVIGPGTNTTFNNPYTRPDLIMNSMFSYNDYKNWNIWNIANGTNFIDEKNLVTNVAKSYANDSIIYLENSNTLLIVSPDGGIYKTNSNTDNINKTNNDYYVGWYRKNVANFNNKVPAGSQWGYYDEYSKIVYFVGNKDTEVITSEPDAEEVTTEIQAKWAIYYSKDNGKNWDTVILEEIPVSDNVLGMNILEERLLVYTATKIYGYTLYGGNVIVKENEYLYSNYYYENNKDWKTIKLINKREAVMASTYNEELIQEWEDPTSRYLHSAENTSLEDRKLLGANDKTGCRFDHHQRTLNRETPWGTTDSLGYNQMIHLVYKEPRFEKVMTDNVLDPFNVAEYSVFEVYRRNWHQAISHYDNKSGIEVNGVLVQELPFNHGFDYIYTISPKENVGSGDTSIMREKNITGGIIVAKIGSTQYWYSYDDGNTFYEREFPEPLEKLMTTKDGYGVILVPKVEGDSLKRKIYISKDCGGSFEFGVTVEDYNDYDGLFVQTDDYEYILFKNTKSNRYVYINTEYEEEEQRITERYLPVDFHVTDIYYFKKESKDIILIDNKNSTGSVNKVLVSGDNGHSFSINMNDSKKHTLISIKSIDNTSYSEPKYKLYQWNKNSNKVKMVWTPINNKNIIFEYIRSIDISEIENKTANVDTISLIDYDKNISQYLVILYKHNGTKIAVAKAPDIFYIKPEPIPVPDEEAIKSEEDAEEDVTIPEPVSVPDKWTYAEFNFLASYTSCIQLLKGFRDLYGRFGNILYSTWTTGVDTGCSRVLNDYYDALIPNANDVCTTTERIGKLFINRQTGRLCGICRTSGSVRFPLIDYPLVNNSNNFFANYGLSNGVKMWNFGNNYNIHTINTVGREVCNGVMVSHNNDTGLDSTLLNFSFNGSKEVLSIGLWAHSNYKVERKYLFNTPTVDKANLNSYNNFNTNIDTKPTNIQGLELTIMYSKNRSCRNEPTILDN